MRFSPGTLLRSSPSSSAGPFETGSPQNTSVDPGDQLSHLRALFPDMDDQLVAKVLEVSGNNLDCAIKSLNELCLSSNGRDTLHCTFEDTSTRSVVGLRVEDGSHTLEAVNVENHAHEAASESEGSEWVELVVREMLNATSLDDARDRAVRALEAFEKTVMARTGSMFEALKKENEMLKEQLQGLLRDNHILKRAVAIQHERQVEHDNSSREMQQLKQLLAQYQEQVRTLELNNYALNLHLRKAQEGTSMPGRFHPDVF